jgi:hypothetical protein
MSVLHVSANEIEREADRRVLGGVGLAIQECELGGCRSKICSDRRRIEGVTEVAFG